MRVENVMLSVSGMFIDGYIKKIETDLIRIFGHPTIHEEIINLGWEDENELLNVKFSFTFNQTDGSKKTFTYCYGDLIDSLDDFDNISSLEKHLNTEYENLRRNLRNQYLHDLYMRG